MNPRAKIKLLFTGVIVVALYLYGIYNLPIHEGGVPMV